MDTKQEIQNNLKGLLNSIIEAKLSYTLWKGVYFSRSSGVVSKSLAEKYVEAQSTAPGFFLTTERAALISFIVLVLHPIDGDSRSFSLFNVDKEETKRFISVNKDVIDSLYLVRNKVFAHKDKDTFQDEIKPLVPTVEKLDIFFTNLVDFYNKLTSEHLDNITIFDSSCDDLLNQTDYLFMNLIRGESIRRKEIDIMYEWEEDSRKISDIFNSENINSK